MNGSHERLRRKRESTRDGEARGRKLGNAEGEFIVARDVASLRRRKNIEGNNNVPCAVKNTRGGSVRKSTNEDNVPR